jgi:hypothetical protein
MKTTKYTEMLAALVSSGVGKKIDPIQLVRADPNTAALLAKLKKDPQRRPVVDSTGKIDHSLVYQAGFEKTSFEIANGMNEAETIFQMHPDLELCAQILISSILAPKDLSTVELTYGLQKSVLPSAHTSALLEKIKTFMDENYKIKEECSKILRSVLFDAGSYPVAVIPENSIDDLINNRVGSRKRKQQKRYTRTAVESHDASTLLDNENRPLFNFSLGILGSSDVGNAPTATKSFGTGMESFFRVALEEAKPNSEIDIKVSGIRTGIVAIDNPATLHVPSLADEARRQNLKRQTRMGIESYDTQFLGGENSNLTVNRIFQTLPSDFTPIRPVLTKDMLHRRSIGNPLLMRLPPESVMPVYVPGYPEKRVGAFIILDNEGNPITKYKGSDIYADLATSFKQNGDLAGSLTNQVKSQMTASSAGSFDFNNRMHIDYAAQIFAGMVEEDLVSRLKNGAYGKKLKISDNTEIYRLMLSRSLKNDYTALLYIPAELLCYFAFRFHENGVGRSLMYDTRIVNSLRSVITFANMLTSTRNAVSRTKVTVQLDEDDPDPQTTFDNIKGRILQERMLGLPTGTSNPTEITNWLLKSGYEFEVTGNKGLPELKIDFSDASSQRALPDPELENRLRNKSIQGFALTPEMVDAGFNVEYATTAVANNLLLAKRVIQIQDDFTPQLASFVQMIVSNSETICYRLRQYLEENVESIIKAVAAYSEIDISTDVKKKDFIEFLLESFIDDITVSLPRPNSATLENQTTYMEAYGKALDVALDNIINQDFLTADTVGEELENKINTIKAVIRSYYMRKEMVKIGMLPELSELTATDDQGKPVVDIYKEFQDHINAFTKSLSFFMRDIRPVRDAADAINEGKDNGGGSTGGEEGSSEDEGGGEDDFDLGGEGTEGEGEEGGDLTEKGDDYYSGDEGETEEGGEATEEAKPAEGEEEKTTGSEEESASNEGGKESPKF